MTIYLKDYQPSAFSIDSIALDIDLDEDVTIVTAVSQFQRRSGEPYKTAALQLDGKHLTLTQIKLNHEILTADSYVQTDTELVLARVPDNFTLEIITEIKPQENTALTGLYKSDGMYCTQCEAEGFRWITYYLDRPDVMTKFTTTIRADKQKYPVLLSNGNLVASGDVEYTAGAKHWVTWVDPFKKPSYLFAMVAGKLSVIEDTYTTVSGRQVALKIYVEPENITKTYHAMAALKQAMHWDEQAYGREYDLDIYMIVAVNSFNMGAMENKGLNIFNSKYILANQQTATDLDFAAIDAVIGHEYFHNWSGNRVTLRDWFQLSLKEGFTVFREQQFVRDIAASPVSRIEEVRLLRARQFVEDAGPIAHPVRPDSYMEINNFYTLTIYEKGAEIIRMLHTIVGAKVFRQATDLYFSRHDGQAVTIEDFVKAIEDASKLDLTQFKLWYTQAGTPELTFTELYDEKNKIYQLDLAQDCKPTPGQPHKQPLYIPVAIGLLDENGKNIQTQVLALTKHKQTFKFDNIPTKPILSLLRDFSAPVKVKTTRSIDTLTFLLQHDSDDFSRWDAGRNLCEQILLSLIKQPSLTVLDDTVVAALRAVLNSKILNLALKAEILHTPTCGELMDQMAAVDPEIVYAANKFFKHELAKQLHVEFLAVYTQLNTGEVYSYNNHAVAARKLKNTCLSYLLWSESPLMLELGWQQYKAADNMTDAIAVLQTVTHIDCPLREQIFADFYAKWQQEPLVINKWLGLQAISELDTTLSKVETLLTDKAFDITNPNKVYALLGGFAISNPVRFHAKSGAGYKFLSTMLLKLNKINPQVAARMFHPFTKWQGVDAARQQLMRTEMKNLLKADLSRDMLELVTKSLK